MTINTIFETSYLACPMCMSAQNGQSQIAASSAIAFLLVILCGVLMSFLTFIVYLAKRERRYAENVEDATH